MDVNITRTCQNCRFWDLASAEKVDGVITGICRRNPPIVFDDDISHFPDSRANDWCGEFRKKV